MRAHSKLLIIEAVVPPRVDHDPAMKMVYALDMQMMVLCPGGK